MIIAIDGPAASGKGTLGKRLAHHYGYRHLDTGVIYRAVAKALMDAGADLTNETLAVSAALELDPEKFGNPALKTQIVGDAASVVSAFPKLRDVLLNFQRQFAADLQIVLAISDAFAANIRALKTDVRILVGQQYDLAQLFVDDLFLLFGKDAAGLDHRRGFRCELQGCTIH